MSVISDQAARILQDRMHIDVVHLVKKIESAENSPHSRQIYQAIEEYCAIVERCDGESAVNEYFESIAEALDEGAEPYFTLDSLRMAFFRFVSGGLRDLYTYQENEAWYPRIILREILGPNDIRSLENLITIYRGCDRAEFDSRVFGQSWTTSRTVAEEFAFEHYATQDWFVSANRVVLTASCLRDDVLYSDQTDYGEFEVVIGAGSVRDVQRAALLQL